MGDTASPAEAADRASRRRTRVLWVLALFYILWQTSFYAYGRGDPNPVRAVDQVKISAWVVWTVVLLALLWTGGAWARGREVRRLLNDEVSVAHRREAQRYGFWAAMFTALGVYALTFFERVGTRDTVHLVMSVAVGAALLRYAMLERRAERAA